MQVGNVFIAMLIGYLWGCIQTSYILGKIVGKMDIRTKGSHNAGASNATMVLGWKYGIITAIVDVLKAILAVVVVKMLYPSSPELAFLSGLTSILGHMFPFYMGFKGGKGVSALTGMLLGYDLRWGLAFLVALIVIILASDFVLVGSWTVFTGLPILTYVFGLPAFVLLLAFLISVIAFIKHSENVVNIRTGEEVRVSTAMKRRKSEQS